MHQPSPPPGDDPVLSEREHRWAPLVLALLVLAAMAVASLPRCAPPAPPAGPAPGASEPPAVLVLPPAGSSPAGLAGAPQAGAQAAEPAPEPAPGEVLHLARVCASEAGLRITADCAAIHAVLLDRARRMGITYRRAVCAYSTRTCRRSRQDDRRWVAWLRLDGRRPGGWPEQASWARHRGAWLELVEHARDILRGDVVAPCEPEHWGGPIDDWRAIAAGWDRVDCGSDALNHFWRVPTQSRRDARASRRTPAAGSREDSAGG